MPPAGFSVEEVVAAVAAAGPRVPPAAVVDRLLRQSGRQADRGDTYALWLLCMVAQAARAGLARQLANTWEAPVGPDESPREDERLANRCRSLRYLVTGLAQVTGLEYNLTERRPPTDSLVDCGMGVETLDAFAARQESALAEVRRLGGELEAARRQLQQTLLHRQALLQAQQEAQEAIRLFGGGGGFGGGPEAGGGFGGDGGFGGGLGGVVGLRGRGLDLLALEQCGQWTVTDTRR